MKKVLAIIAMLVIPGSAMAAGLVGDCYDCHTMHNSENGGNAVAIVDGVVSTTPYENLLKFDCIACHANDPNGTDKLWSPSASGGSAIPQVAHADLTGDLAGGNFSYGLGANGTNDKVHNVKELFGDGTRWETNAPANGAPPGMFNAGSHAGIFTVANNYDQFSCAGALGCHGTRNQILSSVNGTDTLRVGMSAIAGSHHINAEGVKDATNYASGAGHSGLKVAEGYRFIPGLKGYGNEAARWQNIDADNHNEYYGDNSGTFPSGCTACHTGGLASKSLTSSMSVPNNSMSGFCSTCHGNFHSSGGGADAVDNGVSTAFLRHPSDYVLMSGNGSTEYAAYTNYDISAPVARASITGYAGTNGDALVVPANDMVMCLSCHAAHGTPYDYLLRFNYDTMTAGVYNNLAEVNGDGNGGDGCLACHTQKGIIQ